MNFIPYGKQNITQLDIDVVIDVLTSDFLTQGPKVPEFEDAIKEYCKVKYAVAVNSATSALHLACLALGVTNGDVVWTSPITFVASANCALYCGAEIDFVDIDRQTYNISINALRSKLLQAKEIGKLPKVVIPVHLCGQPCQMAEIKELADEYGFRIIEDASHAIGGKYKNNNIGNCQYSDITVFSFHPVKIITTAEGGLATTNNLDLANKMDLLRSHGITRNPALMSHETEGSWYYQQIALGFNYRMTELQAALGTSQIHRLTEINLRRQQIAKIYDNLLKDLPVITPVNTDDSISGLHLYVIRLKLSKINKSRKQVFDYLRSSNIGVNVHYIPIHLQPYYQNMGFKEGDFSEAESYYKETITLPMYPELNDEQINYVVLKLKEALL